jgi:hypothetical protein
MPAKHLVTIGKAAEYPTSGRDADMIHHETDHRCRATPGTDSLATRRTDALGQAVTSPLGAEAAAGDTDCEDVTVV